MSDASWWDPSNPQDGKPIIRHAPDLTGYHVPDERQGGRAAPSRAGRYATVPAARHDGSSYGFDHNRPGLVHVDPGAPDGGVLVDLGSLPKQAIEQAAAAAQYPHQAYYQLGSPPPRGSWDAPAVVRQDDNPHLPASTYVVPTGTQTGRGGTYVQENQVQRPQPLSSLPPQGAPPQAAPMPPAAPMPFAGPYAAQGAAPPPYPYGAPPGYDPSLQGTLAGLAGGLEALSRRLASLERPQQPYEAAEEPERLPKRQSALPARLPRPSGKNGAAVVAGLLPGLPWLGAEPLRPQRRLIFESAEAGTVQAWYHEVVDDAHCVVLVYDTRHEGTQYLPPDRGDTETPCLRLHAPDLDKSYVVSSVGLSFRMGPLDYVVLVKEEESGLDYDEVRPRAGG